MLDWPTPSSPSALHGFLDLTNFYWKFIHQYAVVAEPLKLFLRKDQYALSPTSQ